MHSSVFPSSALLDPKHSMFCVPSCSSTWLKSDFFFNIFAWLINTSGLLVHSEFNKGHLAIQDNIINKELKHILTSDVSLHCPKENWGGRWQAETIAVYANTLFKALVVMNASVISILLSIIFSTNYIPYHVTLKRIHWPWTELLI